MIKNKITSSIMCLGFALFAVIKYYKKFIFHSASPVKFIVLLRLRFFAERAKCAELWGKSTEIWQEILHICSGKSPVEAYRELGRAGRLYGLLDIAEESVKSGLNMHPHNIQLKKEYAEIATHRENWPEAIKRWQEVVEKNDEDLSPSISLIQLSKAILKYKLYKNNKIEAQLWNDFKAIEIQIHKIIAKKSHDPVLMLELTEWALINNERLQAEHQLSMFMNVCRTTTIASSLIIKFINLCNNNNLLKNKDKMYCAINNYSDIKISTVNVLSYISNKKIKYNEIKTLNCDKGLSNHGVWFHEARSYKIVEKVTSVLNEKIVLRHIYKNNISTEDIVPRLYGYIEHEYISIVYMEYLKNIGNVPKFNKHNAVKISDAIIMFEDYLSSIPEICSKKFNINNIVYRIKLLFDKVSCFESKDILKKLCKFVEYESFILTNYPYVACHGDLTFDNMYFKMYENGNISKIKILDFGLCMKYPIGYDFHHFIRESILNKKFLPFLHQMIKNYALAKNIDEQKLYYNATFFAAIRALNVVGRSNNKDFLFKEIDNLIKITRSFFKIRNN